MLTDGIEHPAPDHPGELRGNFTTAEHRAWQSNMKHFTTYRSTELALKRQLIAAVPDLYIKSLKHYTYGYANVTTLQILEHLIDTFGIIMPADLDANLERMNAAWHPPTPIEVLFEQLDSALQFATEGKAPIGEANAVRIGYNLVHKTGQFEVASYHWRLRSPADKTLAAFKTYFHRANADLTTTSSQAGYRAAAAIQPTPAQPTELATLTAVVTQLIAAMATNNTTTSRSARNNTNNATPATRYRGYCWTHGVTHSTNLHDSTNCKKPAAGHQTTATEQNQLGGSTRVWIPRAKAGKE